MAFKVRQAQTSFYRGEFSPLMAARADRPEMYRNGAEALRNFRPLAQGGVRTRPGLKWLATLSYFPAVLIEFVFNPDQRYVFVLSNTRADIYNLTGTLLTSLTSAPWTTAMLTSGKLTFAQSGDTMILCHPDMPMQKLTRTGASAFARAAYAFEFHSSGWPKYAPFYKFVASSITLTPSATTGTGITLTLSGAGGWTADHVGAIIRHKKKQIEITGYTSATVATGTVRETLTDTNAAADWDEEVFSAARGYANCAEFYLDRLWFGGAKSRPLGIWASKIGAYFNFDLGTALASEAIWESVSGSRVSEVRFLVGSRNLLIYCDRSFYNVPLDANETITPGTYEAIEQQPYGTARLRPQVFDGAVIFGQSSGTVVRESLYSDVEQAYSAEALSLQSSHLIAAPTDLAVQYGSTATPEQYALFVNGDGGVTLFHSVRDQKVGAWLPWDTEGTFKSICGADNDIFVAVERSINGQTVWTLETFDYDAAPVDCSKAATSVSPTKTFTGFSHLQAEDVAVYSQGHYIGTYTVDGSGHITLDELAPELEEIEAGFAFTQTVKPMPAQFDLPDGQSSGLVMGLVRTIITVDQSAAFAVNGNDVLLEFAGDGFDSEAPTTTGIIEVYHQGYDKYAQPTFSIVNPAKVTILGLSRDVMIGK